MRGGGAALVGANFLLPELWWEPISLLGNFGGSQFPCPLKLCRNDAACRGWPAQ